MIPQSSLLDRSTYCPLTNNLHAVGLSVAWSCAQAGFLDWASNQAQLRDLERRAPTIRRGVITTARARRRRTPRHARRLFIWGFIGANAAVSVAWAYAAAGGGGDIITSPVPKANSILSRLLLHRGNPNSLARVGGPPPLLRFMFEHLTLSRRNLGEGRWWTLLTCGASHAGPGHLLVNMCEFYLWASRCFDLGVGVRGVAGLAAGSAVCCGLAAVVGEQGGGPGWAGTYMGASGVVCGLKATAILLEPVMGFRIPDVCDVWCPLLVTLLTGCTGDLVGLLFQRHQPPAASSLARGGGSQGVPQEIVGYAGHLGGTAFGVAYWYFWLRSRFGTW